MPKDEILRNYLSETKDNDDRYWFIIMRVLLIEVKAIEEYIRTHKSEMSDYEISNCLHRQSNLVHVMEFLSFEFDDQNCLGDTLDIVDSFEYTISKWIKELL